MDSPASPSSTFHAVACAPAGSHLLVGILVHPIDLRSGECLSSVNCVIDFLWRLWQGPALLLWLLFFLNNPLLLALGNVDRKAVESREEQSRRRGKGGGGGGVERSNIKTWQTIKIDT